MPRHCEMEVQSKSIKRLNSGQGLGDPSLRGDPDRPSDPPFQRMTRLQALQAPVICWLLSKPGLLFDPQHLIYYCIFSVNMSATLSVLSVLDRMCGRLIRIQAQDRFFFLFCFLNSSWEVMTDLTSNEKNKLHPHRIKHAAWPTHSSSNLRQKLIIIKTFQCFIRTTT